MKRVSLNRFADWKPFSVMCNGLGFGYILTCCLLPHWMLAVGYFVIGLMLVTTSFLLERKRTV